MMRMAHKIGRHDRIGTPKPFDPFRVRCGSAAASRFVGLLARKLKKGGVFVACTSNTVLWSLYGDYHVAVHVSRHGRYQRWVEQPFLGGVVVGMGHRLSRVSSVLLLRAAFDPKDDGKTEDIGKKRDRRTVGGGIFSKRKIPPFLYA
jgi:hypothetical protein